MVPAFVTQDQAHFLGWATMVAVLPRDSGGRAPKTVEGAHQRELLTEQVTKIFDMGGGTKADKLLRLDPTHALFYGVSGGAVIPSSLTKNSAGPFKPVKWEHGAIKTNMVEYAGQHRRAALRKVLAQPMAEYAKILDHLENTPEDDVLLKKKEKQLRFLREKGTWLVAFYDMGGCFLPLPLSILLTAAPIRRTRRGHGQRARHAPQAHHEQRPEVPPGHA